MKLETEESFIHGRMHIISVMNREIAKFPELKSEVFFFNQKLDCAVNIERDLLINKKELEQPIKANENTWQKLKDWIEDENNSKGITIPQILDKMEELEAEQ